MIAFIVSLILMSLIDTLLVAFTFSGLKYRYQWQISTRWHFFILVVVFAFLDNYMIPFVNTLDATVTVHNQAIASSFNISSDTPLMSLFSPGFFDVIIWLVQALVAGVVGERIYDKQA